MHLRTALAWLALVLFGASGVVVGDDGSPSAEEKAFHEWWDRLPYPPLAHVPFVRFRTSGLEDSWPARDLSGLEHGFLVSEGDGRALVFTSDLRMVSVETGGQHASDETWRGIELADFERHVRRGLDSIQRTPAGTAYFDRPDPFVAHRWQDPNQSFRLAVLARACAARGHDELARRMWEQSRKELKWGQGIEEAGEALRSFMAGIEEEAGVAFMERFTDPATAWEELARDAHRFAKVFGWERPGMPEVLDRMAVVSRGSSSARKAWQAMTTEERVVDAIARLQDSDYGVVPETPYATRDDGGADPVRALVEIGEAAVPGLIEALSDDRYTRNVYEMLTPGRGQYRSSTDVELVGSVARSILRRIAQDEGVAEGELEDGDFEGRIPTPKTADRLRRVWAAAAARDRVETARRVIVSAGAGTASRARWLAARDPVAAVSALAAALQSKLSSWELAEVLRELAQIPGAEVLELLRGEFARAPTLEHRYAAAWALATRGVRDGVAPMARAWRGLHEDKLRDASWHVGDLPRFLADSGDPEAILALADGLDRRSASLRHRVVCAFLPRRAPTTGPGGGRASPWGSAGAALALDPKSEDVVHALLGERLEDDGAAHVNWSWGLCGPGVDRRVAYAAAQVLAARYPERYQFPSGAHGTGRTRALALVLNTFRAARREPLGPVPDEFPFAEPIGRARVDVLLERALAAGDPAARALATADLELLGRGAVASILARLGQVDRAHPSYVPLSTLASRLASSVCEVRFSGVAPSAELRSFADGLRGQPLDGSRFTALFRHVVQGGSGKVAGVRVRVERPRASSGVVLEVTLMPATPGAAGGNGGWNVSGFELRAGRWGQVPLTMGSWWSDHKAREMPWIEEERALDDALAEPADVELVGELTLTRNQS